jgi:hypothetical protein
MQASARGFFYVGARALLVSHWPVNFAAAVKLWRARLPSLRGRSLCSPAYWVPFVVVGEEGSVFDRLKPKNTMERELTITGSNGAQMRLRCP